MKLPLIPLKKMYSVRLSEGLAKKLKVYAAVMGMTAQEIVERALVDYVAAHPIPKASRALVEGAAKRILPKTASPILPKKAIIRRVK